MDFILPVLLFIGYFLVMKYVLPKMGISTWMSDSCDLPGESQKKSKSKNEHSN